MWLHPRVEIQGPQWFPERHRGIAVIHPWTVWCGHSSDEFGNCALYVTTALLGGVTVFPFLHFQLDVEVPGQEGTAAEWQKWYHRTFERGRLPGKQSAPVRAQAWRVRTGAKSPSAR
jgi:hypothetical protein